MPKRRRRRRKRRRTRRKRRRFTTPSRNMGPLAVKIRAKLWYHEAITLDPGIGGLPSGYAFSCNNLYDPNNTGAGHQPRGWDQLMVLYDHAVVIRAEMYFYVSNADTANASIFAALVRDTNVLFPNQQDILENRFVKVRTLAPENSGKNTLSGRISVNPNAFLGRSKPLADPDLKNSVVAGPSEECFFQIYVFSLPDTVDVGPSYAHVRIGYTAIFIEPKQPAAS